MINEIIERLEEASKRTEILMSPVANALEKNLAESIYKCAINIVKQVAAEHNNGWIKCSDRLPETEVIACNTRQDIIIGYVFNETDSETGFSAENDYEHMYDVIAWMEKPKLYQEAKND